MSHSDDYAVSRILESLKGDRSLYNDTEDLVISEELNFDDIVKMASNISHQRRKSLEAQFKLLRKAQSDMHTGSSKKEPRFVLIHNQVAYLDSDDKDLMDFKPLIDNLKRSRIYKAISLSPKLYKDQITSFWKTAEKVKNGDEEECVVGTIGGKTVRISESILRTYFDFKDSPEDPLELDAEIVKKCCLYMRYQGKFPTLKKGMFPWLWKYLVHIILQCLSNRKAGTDTLNASYSSLMVALVLNKPYNFSKLIYVGMKENLIKDEEEKFLMFPRFVQCLINDQHPDLPKSGEILQLTPMTAYTVSQCRVIRGKKDVYDLKKAGEIKAFGYFAGDDDFVLPGDVEAPVGERAVITESVQSVKQIKKRKKTPAKKSAKKPKTLLIDEPEQAAPETETPLVGLSGPQVGEERVIVEEMEERETVEAITERMVLEEETTEIATQRSVQDITSTPVSIVEELERTKWVPPVQDPEKKKGIVEVESEESSDTNPVYPDYDPKSKKIIREQTKPTEKKKARKGIDEDFVPEFVEPKKKKTKKKKTTSKKTSGSSSVPAPSSRAPETDSASINFRINDLENQLLEKDAEIKGLQLKVDEQGDLIKSLNGKVDRLTETVEVLVNLLKKKLGGDFKGLGSDDSDDDDDDDDDRDSGDDDKENKDEPEKDEVGMTEDLQRATVLVPEAATVGESKNSEPTGKNIWIRHCPPEFSFKLRDVKSNEDYNPTNEELQADDYYYQLVRRKKKKVVEASAEPVTETTHTPL